MACERRQRTGTCKHYQCPLAEQTAHGYECVEIDHILSACEVGAGCIPACPYSYAEGSDKAKKVEEYWRIAGA